MPDITNPQWVLDAPDLPVRLPPDWRRLWREAWGLHARSCRAAKGAMDDTWETVGPGYFMPAFGHWDIVHCVLDLCSYDPTFAARQVRLIVRSMRESDACIPSLIRELPDGKGEPAIVPDYGGCAPPLWPVGALAAFEKTRDAAFLRLAYDGAVKNLRWWIQNRRLPDGLFWFSDCLWQGSESGYDVCPRWDGFKAAPRLAACVDLCAQMGMCYDALGSMAEALGQPQPAAEWRAERDRLAEQVRTALWDDTDGLFYDGIADTGERVRVKTVGCFWPMVAGQATPYQARRLASHLANPAEFFVKVPVPSVAQNDPSFELDGWRGPTWLSQTYWVMRGLRRYGYRDLAAEIGRRALTHASRTLAEHGAIFEFYHPNAGPPSELRRKGDARGPCRDYIGHNPIHAIALELVD